MLFEEQHRNDSPKHRRLYAAFEMAYTLIDFIAALSFIIGSICFFFDSLMTAGTWLFLIGSICFAAKPTIRLVRDIKLAAMGDRKDLAARYKD